MLFRGLVSAVRLSRSALLLRTPLLALDFSVCNTHDFDSFIFLSLWVSIICSLLFGGFGRFCLVLQRGMCLYATSRLNSRWQYSHFYFWLRCEIWLVDFWLDRTDLRLEFASKFFTFLDYWIDVFYFICSIETWLVFASFVEVLDSISFLF